MNRIDLAVLENASRSVMAFDPMDRPAPVLKLAAAVVPAVGILLACTMTLIALL